MPTDKNDPVTKKITDFVLFMNKKIDSPNTSKKRPINVTSLPETNKTSKKINRDIEVVDIKGKMEGTESTPSTNAIQQAVGLRELLTPLTEEVRSLKENMDKNYSTLDEKYTKLETRLDEKYTQLKKVIATQKDESSKEFRDLKEVITKQCNEITQEVSIRLETNRRDMNLILKENRTLKQQYSELAERLNKIETNQLSNNAIITGVPEEPWESFDSTKQRIHDVIASAIQDKFPDKDRALAEAKSFNILYCTRVGRQCRGTDRAISVTFQKKQDKEKLMATKNKLL